MKDTLVVSAFPACGKSYFCQHSDGLVVLDSDSSQYSWSIGADGKKVRNPDFPSNYIKHIKDNIGMADFILVSSHKAVRDAMREAGIKYLLVYPSKELLEEYTMRCTKRGNNGFPIQVLIDNWDTWISQCEDEAKSGTPYIMLFHGEYLSDALIWQ